MSDKSNLNEQGYEFSIVLDEDNINTLKSDRNIFDKLMSTDLFDINILSVIMHDQDVDEEISHIKTLHYHCAVRFNNKYRVGTILKRVSDIFHINENIISVKKLSSLASYTRYLIHLDNSDKFQYMPFDIITNNNEYVSNVLKLIQIKDIFHCLNVVQRFHYRYEEIITNVVNWKSYNSLIKDFIRMRN